MLDVSDLHRTLDEERHLGWGYACCDAVTGSRRVRLDRAIVAVANELELSYGIPVPLVKLKVGPLAR